MPAQPHNSAESLTTPLSDVSINTDVSFTTPTAPALPTPLIPPQTPFTFQPRRVAQTKTKNGQCTHLTMTRMYSTEYRCMLCGHHSSNGWLFRCIQDRELMLEDDLERGYAETFDDLDAHFPVPSRRPRGPVARSSKLSFLEEVEDKYLNTYTASQIGLIIEQRSHALRTAETQALSIRTESQSSTTSPATIYNPRPPSPTKSILRKPWLPLPIGECQFKTCLDCRPSARERSFLSLDGIANDDFPATALTGFGFHLLRARPVVPARVAENLGLRESRPMGETQEVAEEVALEKRNEPSMTGKAKRPLPELPTKNMAMAITLPLLHEAVPTLSSDEDTKMVDITKITPDRIPTEPTKRFPTLTKSSKTPERIPDLRRNMGAASLHPTLGAILTENINPQTDITKPMAIQKPVSDKPATQMEEQQSSGGFGAAPLELPEGIAVTEEAVELHVADLITQF